MQQVDWDQQSMSATSVMNVQGFPDTSFGASCVARTAELQSTTTASATTAVFMQPEPGFACYQVFSAPL
jgi:hypothetical protein